MGREEHLKRGNLLWESSRMMLPEHKEQWLDHRRTSASKPRPVVDEQQLEQWSDILAGSLATGRPLAVTLYGPLQNRQISGTVRKWSPLERKLQLVHDGTAEWIRMEDIVDLAYL